ncbi:hypothetical protein METBISCDRAFT_21531 [Metschnikowia bicuspidata]|uniref:Uncharacterized protein n=1 Tax=Metschnikowia bicuspidata TaxID=27322 RepID=A0A4P9ZIT3_9ASCO|nr:hypothetical protein METBISCDRAFT_21531 [Metschnikowia bicuspidata]
MSKKVFLGLALVGGGLYYYDQNVEPIFSKRAAVPLGKPSKEVRQESSKLEDKAKDFGSLLKKTADEGLSDLKNRTESAVSSIKNSETYNNWSTTLEDYKKDVKVAADNVEEKPLPNRLAAKYIDAINRIGQTDDKRLKELVSATSARQQELKGELAQSQSTWYSWLMGKQDDAKQAKNDLASKAEKEKKSWLNWGSAKKDDAQNAAKDAEKILKAERDKWVSWGSSKADALKAAKGTKQDLKAEKDRWMNWSSTKADEAKKAAQDAHKDASDAYYALKNQLSESFEAGRQRAITEYNRAKQNLDDLTNQAQARTIQPKNRVEDDGNLKRAKSEFQSALSNLKRFDSDLVDGK